MLKEVKYIDLFNELIKVLKPQIFYLDWTFWSVVILFITLLILFWYSVETRNIAIQTKESNLRPVILRSGYIPSWESINFELKNDLIEGNIIQFKILKNIATSICGYIIINNFTYELLFGNEITKIEENKISYLKTWSWQGPSTNIYAIFDSKKRKKCIKSNQIVINYKDIEGNSYYTIEDSNWNQKSFKGNLLKKK